jgi:CheY-like chemotaxis protein
MLSLKGLYLLIQNKFLIIMGAIIDTIILVDDDMSTNFLNKLIINDREIAKKIINLNNGEELLNFLNDSYNKIPDAILIDINMPVMDGWEFLDIIEKQKNLDLSKCKIIILTASQNPDDLEKAKKYTSVNGFLNKPLDCDLLIQIIKS